MAVRKSDEIVRECVSCKRCYDSRLAICPDCMVELVNVETIPRLIQSRYRLERVLGKGGMGRVFAATDLQANEGQPSQVAVKVLRSSVIASPQAQDRFQEEAQIATEIRHPNITEVYEFGLLPDASGYVIAELAAGESLRAKIKKVGKFSPPDAIAILIQVAEGLEAAHRAGLVHRDLKPENILIRTDEEEQLQVKIIDFAFAKVAGPRVTKGTTTKLSRLPQTLGTPTYMSPEQFRGEETDHHTDIYSLGIIAYEMLAGRPPFKAKSISEYATLHLSEQPAPLKPLNHEVNRALESAIMKAIEKDLIHRYERVSQFRRDLLNAGGVS